MASVVLLMSPRNKSASHLHTLNHRKLDYRTQLSEGEAPASHLYLDSLNRLKQSGKLSCTRRGFTYKSRLLCSLRAPRKVLSHCLSMQRRSCTALTSLCA